jgi:hypothetical protein
MATPHRLRHHAGALRVVEWHATRSLVEEDENDGRGTLEAQRAGPDHKDRYGPRATFRFVRDHSDGDSWRVRAPLTAAPGTPASEECQRRKEDDKTHRWNHVKRTVHVN